MEGGGRRKERTADRSLEKKFPPPSTNFRTGLPVLCGGGRASSSSECFPGGGGGGSTVVVGLAPAAFLAGPEIVHYHAHTWARWWAAGGG